METKYFKTNDGKFLKLDYDYSQDSFSPRDPSYQINLGTMVFPKVSNRRYTLGDIQPENFEEFFKDELSEKEGHDFMEGTIEFELPTLEDCQNNEALSRFIAGTEENGYHFDIDLFNQELDGVLSAVKDNLGASICEDLSGGIPIDENTGKLTGNYIIDLRTANCNGYIAAENAWNQIRNELSSYLNDLLPRYSLNRTDSILAYNDLDDLTESQLFDKWAETKLCVIPINIFEHSGITCHEASLRKTLHATNDRDDGAIYNDGFIYVNKDNKEVLNELKGEARDKDGNVYNKWKAKTPKEVKEWAEAKLRAEIKEYASYLEGNVYDVSVYEFDPKTMDWGEPVVGYNFLITDDVEKYISENNEYAGKIKTEIHSEVMKEIENTPTAEYKEACFESFKTKIKEILPEFDGNPKYAFSAASIALKNNPLAALERTALSEYMKEKGCDTEVKLFDFIDKSLGIKAKDNTKTIKPVSLSFSDSSLDCIYSKIKNPQRSDNGGVNNLLLIDWDSKRYSFIKDCSYLVNCPSDRNYHKVELLSSGKAVEGRLNSLIKAGFKNTPVKEENLECCRKKDDWIKKFKLKETERER